ncbi:hypothetical protein XNC3_530007 [Xenorhabdus nematophila F1]|nr:hypothetical protein XNC3_530007 [Xenorhabdus nematophila F1]
MASIPDEQRLEYTTIFSFITQLTEKLGVSEPLEIHRLLPMMQKKQQNY